MFIYPTDNTDDLQKLAALIGSFWTDAYQGYGDVINLLRTYRESARQLGDQVDELVATVGRQTCPVFHTQNWYSFTINQSQELPYGSTGSRAVAYTLPASVIDFAAVTNGMAAPAVLLGNGSDVRIANSQLVFLASPFTNPQLRPEPVLDMSGNVVDQQLALGFLGAALDWQYLYQQFGYVAGVEATSSILYSQLLNAILDNVASGTSYDAVARIVEAAADVALTRNAQEIVEDISAGPVAIVVVTDREIYSFNPASTLMAAIGTELHRNDPLVDTIQIWEPSSGASPPFLSSITLGSGFLAPGIGNLTFTDAVVPLTVTTGVNGYTKVTWPLGGASGDVTTFFNDLHTRGVANGATLANYLDLRTVKVGQPDATMLPTTINPYRFLFANVLRFNVTVIQLRSSLFGPNALGNTALTALRQCLPPGTSVIVVQD